MEALQLGKIDSVAIQSETKDKQRHEKARQNNAPADVTQRRFVNAVVTNHHE